ncbi:cytochrome P450 [Mycena metata]|uniref:Cytochrome P450 n=1 Tax=Mycena metata TaxID=1033252 RepID=A0AAD7HC63_9AGAR|nr:cytochrome P450 [Mycena metata]
MALLGLAASIAAALGVYILHALLKVLYQEFTSPLRNVPGPEFDDRFVGNRLQIFTSVEDDQEGLWTAQYGRTVRINTFLGFSQLFTTDTKAVQHILSNSDHYQKPAMRRYFLGRVVGPGVLVVEEDVHKKQVRINCAVPSPLLIPFDLSVKDHAQVRALTGIFVEKSRQLRDLWADRAAQSGGIARVNVIPDFSTTTLDIIGQAGFKYDFHSLGADSSSGRDELHEAFATISAAGDRAGLMDALKGEVPLLRKVLPRRKIDKVIDNSQAVMRRIGQRLLRDSKQKIALGSSVDSVASRDLLSLLVRANMTEDIPEAQRLSDEDVLAQVPTFLVAGHETTAATWALFALAENKEIQTRLRDELLTVDNANPSMDELNDLHYLDCVVRETLRAHAPVVASFRVAMRDDVIPLGTPYTDRTGAVHETLRHTDPLLTKGQTVVIPILALNRDSAIWGPDAQQFIPERWERSSPISTSIPGLWSQMLTFLGGPRACIGYRFSLVELKALLFTLVRGLEFELAVPAADIGRVSMALVQQPVVRSDRAAGAQLPLLIKPFIQS